MNFTGICACYSLIIVFNLNKLRSTWQIYCRVCDALRDFIPSNNTYSVTHQLKLKLLPS